MWVIYIYIYTHVKYVVIITGLELLRQWESVCIDLPNMKHDSSSHNTNLTSASGRWLINGTPKSWTSLNRYYIKSLKLKQFIL
jgi:hypothetical protein